MERCGRPETLLLLVVLVLCWLMVVPVAPQVRHALPVLWMMPRRENVTVGVDAAVRLALQDLDKQPAPLGNYQIQLEPLDSQCDPAKALKALFDAMWAGPKYLLLFGEVCPSVTSFIARSLPALDLVQVSFAATPPGLVNRKWAGSLFSTVPSDRAVNRAAVKLLRRYNWTRVGLVAQETPRLSQMQEDLMRQLLESGVQVVSSHTVSEDVCGSLRRLKDEDVRIIIAQFEEASAAQVFCCAYRLNLFGARYQWIVMDGEAAGWRPGGRVSGCASDSVVMAADGSIRLRVRPLGGRNTPGISGRTPQDYHDSYLRQLRQEGSQVSPLHGFAYDSVWVAATAACQVMEALRRRERNAAQRNVTLGEEEVNEALLEAVRNTQFEGVTGPVLFRNGERMSSIDLIQFQGGSGVLIGEFATLTQQLSLQRHLLKFKGLGPARDQTLVRLQHLHISLLLNIIISSAAALTLIVTLFVLLHRRRRYSVTATATAATVAQRDPGHAWTRRRPLSVVRLLDELLLLGLLLCSSSVLLSGLDRTSVSVWTFELLCCVRLWTLSLGHAVGVAVLIAKTWTLKQKQQQQSRRLLLWLLLLDVFVLASWQILDPLRRVVLQHRSQSLLAEQDVVVQTSSEHCSSVHMELWLAAVCGYKGLLLAVGCVLAWSVRSAVSGKQLALSVSAVAAFSVSGALASRLTTHNPPLQFCLSSVFILCCCVCVLICTFAPTMFQLWLSGREPQDQNQDQNQNQDLDQDLDQNQDLDHDLDLDLDQNQNQNQDQDLDQEDELSRMNQQLKSQSAQLDVEIESIVLLLWDTCLHEVRRSERKRPDDINSPEHVRRRLSVQLPILHHSYLPVVGGVSSSSSSLFHSEDTPTSAHDL